MQTYAVPGDSLFRTATTFSTLGSTPTTNMSTAAFGPAGEFDWIAAQHPANHKHTMITFRTMADFTIVEPFEFPVRLAKASPCPPRNIPAPIH
jgi:hypothetical protein